MDDISCIDAMQGKECGVLDAQDRGILSGDVLDNPYALLYIDAQFVSDGTIREGTAPTLYGWEPLSCRASISR